MSCPTCDGTMSLVLDSGSERLYHCDRCGTIKSLAETGLERVYRPLLVGRCQKFARLFKSTDVELVAKWKSFGIAEAIGAEERSSPDATTK